MAVRRVLTDGTLSEIASFATAEPQAPDTRLAVMSLLGEQLAAAMKELLATAPLDKDGEPDPSPVHLVVPDRATADACFGKMQDDPDFANMDMPFDGKRMIYGGFEPILTLGSGA